jgi:hypothetical protein
MQTENLADLVNIAASLKNNYNMVPCAVAVQGEPMPNALKRLSDGYDAAQQADEPAVGLAAPGQRFGRPAWLSQSHAIRSQLHISANEANSWQTRTMDARG